MISAKKIYSLFLRCLGRDEKHLPEDTRNNLMIFSQYMALSINS